MTDLLTAKKLTITRGGRTLLKDLELTLPAGSVTALTGPNGSGKTTLARCLGLYDLDFSGTVSIDGLSSSTMRPRHLRQLHRHKVAIQFQDLMLEPSWSAGKNLRYAAWALALPWRERKTAVSRALDAVGALHLSGTTVDRLSGGEQARVALARALLTPAPSLLILDEPTASADTLLNEVASSVLRAAADRGAAALVVSHDPQLVQAADREVSLAPSS